MENVVGIKKKREIGHNAAALFLGVRPSTLYSWNNEGRGPRHTRRFGRLTYLEEDLEAFMRANSEIRGSRIG
jgi:predicted site-specific integrase-resolvase